MSYFDRLSGKDGRYSVYDIYRLNPNNESDWNAIKAEYDATPISQIIIDGNLFNNYGAFSFAWEKTYVKQPERSANGTIDNLNSYATFVTPHIVIDFSILSIDDFREIVRLDLEKNEFVVEFYDPIFHKVISRKMYFGTLEIAKIHTMQRHRFNEDKWEEFTQIMGVQDYTIELIGTNASLDLVSVIYHLNPPADTGVADRQLGEDDVYIGQDIIVGTSATEFVNETFEGRYKFTKWNVSSADPTVSKDKGNYINGNVYTIQDNLVLYAQWERTTTHTLFFNYGVSNPVIENNRMVMSKLVTEGEPIGELPSPQMPEVVIDGIQYTPYSNGHWYKTPVIPEGQEDSWIGRLDDYWTNHDDTIYWLYKVALYPIKYYLEGELIKTHYVAYNNVLPSFEVYKEGKKFDGWYTDQDYKTKVSGKMPPKDLELWGKWVDK